MLSLDQNKEPKINIMKRLLPLLLLAAVLLSGCQAKRNPDLAPYAEFREGKIGSITPTGWIATFLERQVSGMTGHPEALDYPYDSPLWAGVLDRNMTSYGCDWWRYEQTAYYTDGLLRLGYLLRNETLIEKGEQGIAYTLDHVAETGELGQGGFWSRWPLAVFFRAMQAYYEVTGDEAIVDALERHYLYLIDSGERIGAMMEYKRPWRNILTIEGLLWVYAHTGNSRLLEYACAEWDCGEAVDLNMACIESDEAPFMHGVTYTEELKLPMLLYAYTGREEYLTAALRADEKLDRFHMLPDGVPSSNEHLRGQNPRTSHETCDITDYTWSLGYFLQTTGEGRWADKIERALFNAAPGAITKDFKALQYFSSPNQVIATGYSDHNELRKGQTWMAYRPTHETECCAGNVHRMMPNYVSRMWMEGARENELVAALYGPSTIRHELSNGECITLHEETHYPFSEQIRFRFEMEHSARLPFTFRIPAWCREASLQLNGKPIALEALASEGREGFYTLERRFRPGDTLTLNLPMEVEVREWVDGGCYVERGPLLYAYSIPSTWKEDRKEYAIMHGKVPGNPDFKCWSITPAAPWNYTPALGKGEKPEVVLIQTEGYPYDEASTPCRLRLPVRRVKDWGLEEGRYTPTLPTEFETEGAIDTLELIPYGATTLRLTVFPKMKQE